MNDRSRLIALFWELNHLYFGGILPPPELRFSGRLRTTGGQYFRQPKRLIQVSTRYLAMDNAWEEIRDTLGHEMIHYWLDFRGRPCGHTPEFRAKLRACGFARYSRLMPVRMRYLYVCVACATPYFRKRQGVWSCGPCSGKRFNFRYKLALAGRIDQGQVSWEPGFGPQFEKEMSHALSKLSKLRSLGPC